MLPGSECQTKESSTQPNTKKEEEIRFQLILQNEKEPTGKKAIGRPPEEIKRGRKGKARGGGRALWN